MGFVGTYNIYTIVTSDLVKRVADWASLTTSINTALASVQSTLSAAVTALGPAWAPTRTVPSNADLNTYKVPGQSRISTPDSGTIANMPPGCRTACILENQTSGDGTDSYWGQKVTEYGINPRTWWRVSSDTSGNFNPWAIEGTQATKITEWHVFLAVGQSNMSGRGIVGTAAGGRYVQPRIAQFGYTRRVLETATVPLDMHDTSSGLSPATTFAQAYLKSQPNHVGVLIVPAAHGGTGFTTSTTTQTWTPGITTNPLYDLPGAAVAQVASALSAVAATGAASVLKGILWHQGEDNSTMPQATYAQNLDALIAYFRAQLNAPTLPFVVGQMAPENIAAIPGRINIDAAHRDTPRRVMYTGFAPARTNGTNPGDLTHFSQDGVDFLGRNYIDAFEQAQENITTWGDEANGRMVTVPNPIGGTQAVFSDTGWREISVLFPTFVSGNIYARRSGPSVWLDFQSAIFSDPSGTNAVLGTGLMPAVFRSVRNTTTLMSVSGTSTIRRLLTTAGGSLTLYNTVAGEAYTGCVNYAASTPFGTAALPAAAAGTIPTS